MISKNPECISIPATPDCFGSSNVKFESKRYKTSPWFRWFLNEVSIRQAFTYTKYTVCFILSWLYLSKVACFKCNKYVSLPQSVVNIPYFYFWGRRRSSDTPTNIYAREIHSNFNFYICFLSGGKNCLSCGGWAVRILNVQFVSRYYRNIIYENNYNKSNNEQAQVDRIPNHDMNFIPRIYVGTSLINCLKDVKLRS